MTWFVSNLSETIQTAECGPEETDCEMNEGGATEPAAQGGH